MITTWSITEAFSRNKGLISTHEQTQLQEKCVAIAGCGGIGSTVSETLARLGIGKFRLCDTDNFSVANINRQTGATIHSLGQNKAQSTKERILSINPKAKIEIFPSLITAKNADSFVTNIDLLIDGIDFFEISDRRSLFKAAQTQGVTAMTSAPLGFSATLLIFSPHQGMSFDNYFNFKKNDTHALQLLKFLVGLAPSALHKNYIDFSEVNIKEKTGPSSIIGTQLASCLLGSEAIRLLLKRNPSLFAPWYRQFDAYEQRWIKKRLFFGNKHPLQKLKLSLAKQSLQKVGVWHDLVTDS